jgi:hypothetical protein
MHCAKRVYQAMLAAAPSPAGDSEAGMSEDQLVELIHRWFTEEWRSDLGDKWKEDVLLTGCRKVGNGRGYQKPEEAAANLRRDLARAILAVLPRAQPPQPTGDVGELVERLRKMARCVYLAAEGSVANDLSDGLTKAADALVQANSRIARQDRLLRQLAHYYDINDCHERSAADALEVPISDLREAHKIMQEKPK